MAASSAPNAPNHPERVAMSLSGTMVASTCSASVVTFTTGMVLNNSRTAWRTCGATASGSILVRRHQEFHKRPGFSNRQQPQHQRVDQAEDGGVGTDAQCQREDGHGGE